MKSSASELSYEVRVEHLLFLQIKMPTLRQRCSKAQSPIFKVNNFKGHF